ncbi:MAG: hypothetical protein JWP00_2447 [Chloroflexi bacterium]|nr:hypothetical protein [Chloroflexota bacterium]
MSYNPPAPDFNPPPDAYPAPSSNFPASPSISPAGDRPTPTPAIANLCFFVGVLAFLTFSVIAQINNWGFFWTSFMGELALASVAIFFCIMGRYKIKETLNLRRLDLWTVFLCLLAGFVGQFAVRFPTALNQWIMELFGPFPVDQLFPNPKDLPGRLLFFFAVGLFGPVCEEILNRGFVQTGYSRLSFWKCIFFVGLLFGLFHLYPFRFAYTFLLGMALAYLVLVTGSLWSAIAAHIGFNLLGAFSPWIIEIVDQLARDNGQSMVSGDGAIDLATLLATIPISLIAGGIFFLLLRSVTRRMAKRRPALELGYLGLARNIRTDLAGATGPTGPYFGPDRRYNYGRYGYERANYNYLNNPAGGPVIAPATPVQAGPVNQQGMPQAAQPVSPYLTPQGFTPAPPLAYPAIGQAVGTGYAAGQPAGPLYAWNTPPAPRPQLSRQASRWWKLSFILIFLFYFYTTLTEISIRLSPEDERVPQTPSSQVTTSSQRSEVSSQWESIVVSSQLSAGNR